jgi:hypothetical protein
MNPGSNREEDSLVPLETCGVAAFPYIGRPRPYAM